MGGFIKIRGSGLDVSTTHVSVKIPLSNMWTNTHVRQEYFLSATSGDFYSPGRLKNGGVEFPHWQFRYIHIVFLPSIFVIITHVFICMSDRDFSNVHSLHAWNTSQAQWGPRTWRKRWIWTQTVNWVGLQASPQPHQKVTVVGYFSELWAKVITISRDRTRKLEWLTCVLPMECRIPALPQH